MKKAQAAQVFIYITALVIVAVLLFYGYSTITAFIDRGEKVALVQLESKLKSSVLSLTTDFGSVKFVTYNAPSNIKELCFVENYPDYPSNLITSDQPLIADSVNSKVDENVFLLSDTLEDSFLVGKVEIIEGSIICFPVLNGIVRVRLEGAGNHVIVSEQTIR